MKSTCLTVFADSICYFTQSLQIMAHVHEKVPMLPCEGYLIINAFWHFFSLDFVQVDFAEFQIKLVFNQNMLIFFWFSIKTKFVIIHQNHREMFLLSTCNNLSNQCHSPNGTAKAQELSWSVRLSSKALNISPKKNYKKYSHELYIHQRPQSAWAFHTVSSGSSLFINVFCSIY